jgi:circadian clock protein KaiB
MVDSDMHKPRESATKRYERLVDDRKHERFVLRLYVTGMTPRSCEAIGAIRAICEKHLADRFELEVIDIYEHPALAAGEQILAAPTLVKQLPLPLRRLIGNLADTERVLLGLDLQPSA